MKFKNEIIFLTVFLIFSTSCSNDFLNVAPEDQLIDQNFWQSEQDIDLALTGLYNGWESAFIVRWDMMTDNGYSQFPWENTSMIGNGSVSPANTGVTFFDYNQIRKCNKFLENIQTIDSIDDTEKLRYIAEARFLRAYDYFRKVEFYGDVPLVTEVIESPDEAALPRDPKKEVVSFILNELEEIAPDLPVQNIIQSGGHITQGAALALKARLQLYEEMYEEAMADAKKVMDMNVYNLHADYRRLFLEENNEEAILQVEYVENNYSNDLYVRILPASEGGYSSVTAVQNMVDAYEMANGKTIDDPSSGYNLQRPFENRDPRLHMTILYPGRQFNGKYFNSLDLESPDYHENAAAPRSGYGVLKYSQPVPSELLFNGGLDVNVIRLAEVYLTYAEAAIESGQIDESVYDTIDKVRTRAGMPEVDRTVYNSQSKLRELIRRERRVELAFEGLRYWDIKRWDIGMERMNGPLYGTREGSVNPENGTVTWEDERIILEQRNFYPERNYLLPIPQNEMDANPELEQNPGY